MIIKNVNKIIGYAVLSNNTAWKVERVVHAGRGKYALVMSTNTPFKKPPQRVLTEVELILNKTYEGLSYTMRCEGMVQSGLKDDIHTIPKMLNKLRYILPM